MFRVMFRMLGKFSHMRPLDDQVALRPKPSAPFDEILKREARKREYDEQAESNCVKLPALLKTVPGARFEHEAERADHEIEHDHFADSDPCAFFRGP